MFTFREMTQKTQRSIHSHRLLYLHSTQKDKSILENSKRCKTQPFDKNQDATNIQTYYTNNKPDNSKKLRYASQRKIKYFDLDLRGLVDRLSSQRQSQKQIIQAVKCLNKNLEPKTSSPKKSLISNQIAKSSIETKINTSCHSPPINKNISNQVFRQIENLLHKEYIPEINNLQAVRDFKKAKNIALNNKLFKQKYAKMKISHYQPYTKLFSSNYLKSKPNKQKQNQQNLQVKRVERLLMDKMGNQYKVIIQKVL